MSETIAEIVECMRGRGEDTRMDAALWRRYADRIEAAWKREKAEIEAGATSKMLDGATIIDNRSCGDAIRAFEDAEEYEDMAEWLRRPGGGAERRRGMRHCVGEDAECNGPDCGHAEDCPYYFECMKDSSLRDELERCKQTKEGDGDVGSVFNKDDKCER